MEAVQDNERDGLELWGVRKYSLFYFRPDMGIYGNRRSIFGAIKERTWLKQSLRFIAGEEDRQSCGIPLSYDRRRRA